MAEKDESAQDVLKSYIFNSNDPNINQQLRQRIALAMMTQKKQFPKNAGEGITAIGEALGENRLRNQLEAGDLAQQEAAKNIAAGITNPNAAPAGPPVASPYAPAGTVAADDAPPPVAARSLPPPPAATSAPSGLLTRSAQEGQVGPYANNPAQAASLMSPRPSAGAPPMNAPPLPTGSFAPPGAPPMPVSNGGYNVLDQAANAPPPDPAVRAAIASSLNGQQPAQAVPPPNPMLAGQPAPPPLSRDLVLSSDPAAGSPTGNMPANTIALRAPTGIKAAPPAVPPLQAAPPPQQVAQALGTPGYVTPKQTMYAPPTRTPMSPQEKAITQAIIDNPNNSYVMQRLKPTLDQLQADRTSEDARKLELWKSDLAHKQALDLKREEQLNKRGELSHTTVEGRLMMPDPNKPIGSPWIDVTASRPGQKGDGPPVLSKALPEHEDKSQKFLTQMILAEKQLEGKEHLLANSPGQAILSKFGGNALMNRNYLTALNAAKFGVAANLRDISGAVIAETEEVKQYRLAMPVLGDPPSEIAAKRARRKAIMDSMYGGLGPDGRAVVDYSKQEMVKKHDDEQAKINQTMNEKLGPQPKGFVSRNRKTGESRVFDGKNWLDYTP